MRHGSEDSIGDFDEIIGWVAVVIGLAVIGALKIAQGMVEMVSWMVGSFFG